MAAGYDNGDVKLFAFPCVEETKTGCKAVYGVSTYAARIVFTKDGRFMVVLDACSRAILQFNIVNHL
jgi:hypothetical protein